jgi:hypothetical protein
MPFRKFRAGEETLTTEDTEDTERFSGNIRFP